ncbi:MAG: 1,4-alpha-glucan branching protein GlgB [Chloroflexota bacterium]
MAKTGSRDTIQALTNDDLYLFGEGSFFRSYEKLGCHLGVMNDKAGAQFAVWAPNAEYVSVKGSFNDWDRDANPLKAVSGSGIWAGFIEGVKQGDIYKYQIDSRHMGYKVEKADPYALYAEVPPHTASVVWDLDYEWNDDAWMRIRKDRNRMDAPMSIYEMHAQSWRHRDGRPLTYREMAEELPAYMREMGFTHVEFLPLMEHPFDGSWGYQTTGYFAPTSRFGTPQDFMFLVDSLHQAGIGVILDWVPSHFPTDMHGLDYFDGTHLFEHSDPRKGFHPDWKSDIFNYGRHEVRSFLISSALFWMDKYHIDGIRVDAVASMLYLDYSREDGEWIPNEYGGNENLEAIDFLKRLNTEVYSNYPDVQMIAEESTAWPMVSRPTYVGGLGFGFKWDMGWMHDTLEYMSREPIYRYFHHGEITFRMLYAFTENYVLPLSHDEVVHGKGSLIHKMPGDDWQRFASLRLLYSYMWAQPAKKLLFMGSEFGQRPEWNHKAQLEWYVLEHSFHRGVQQTVKDLNRLYRAEPALHEMDIDPEGFQWIDANDAAASVLSFIRTAKTSKDIIACVFNFTPVVRSNYRLGVPRVGEWQEIFNSDADVYNGSGQGNQGVVYAEGIPYHGYDYSMNITVPPLGAVFFKSGS